MARAKKASGGRIASGTEQLRSQAVEAIPTTSKPRRRQYEGARVGRLTADWVTSSTSADAEINSSLVRLRDRARQLVRDNDYARAALRAVVNNVVGTGIRMQAQVPMLRGKGRLDQATNDRIEAAWARWGRKETCHTGGTLSWPDIERLVIRAMAEAGEVFVRLVPQPFGGGQTPLALEVIEADLLDERVDGAGGIRGQIQGGEWRLGVHQDDWGRPIEYAFLQTHPGDARGRAVAARHVLVPAEQIIHLRVTERPGQSRGVTWFASAIKQLHQLAGYAEAEVVRARAASSLMGFITTDGDAAGESLGEEVEGEYVTQFEPGVFKTLFPGQGVTVPQLDAPDGQFEPFVRVMLQSMAAGLGVSFESVSKDFSRTNYSSSRMSLLEERENWRALQQQLIRDLHQPVFRAWMRAAVGSGDLSLPGYSASPERYEEAVKWVPRGWEWVDPTKEGAAYRMAVRDGFMTQAEVVMSRGGDYQELLQSRAAELTQCDDLGLVFDTDPRQTTGAGISQAVATGQVDSTPDAAADSAADPSTSSEADGPGSMTADPQAADGSSA
jgi:lambda family phage portal protein